jgi:hypothetical protein
MGNPKPSMGHGGGRQGLQSLVLQAILTIFLDGPILGALCIRSCLGRFVAEHLLG